MASYSTDGITPVNQVLAQTWHTKVPVHLSLAPDNISSPTAVRPIYLMAPRQGYLGVLAAQAWPHLQHVLPSVPGRPGPPRAWFDWQGVPLKWQIPCGVLYDLLADVGELPWRLTVHYTHPPDSLAGWDTGATPQSQFMNSLKESCFICRGPDGSGSVMRMGSAAQDELWAAVQAGDVAAYRSALEGLRVAPTQRQGNPPSIPVRLLLRRSTPAAPAASPARTTTTTSTAAAATPNASAAPSSSAGSNTTSEAPPQPGPVPGTRSSTGGAASMMAGGGTGAGGMWESYIMATSRPVPALQGVGGAPTSLAQLLHTVLPHLFPDPAAALSAGGSATEAQPSQQPVQAALERAAPVAHGLAAAPTQVGAVRADATAAQLGTLTVAGPAETGVHSRGAPDRDAEVERSGSNGAGAGSGAGQEGSLTVRPVPATVAEGGPGGRQGQRQEPSSEGVGGADGESRDADVRGSLEPSTSGRDRPLTGAGRTSEGQASSGAGPSGAPPPAAQSVTQPAGAGAGAGTENGTREPSPAAAGAIGASDQPGPPGAEKAGDKGAGAAPARWPACRVVVGGICPHLSAPIGWLHATMHAPDLFLYVVVRMGGEAEVGVQAAPGGAAAVGRGGGSSAAPAGARGGTHL